MSTYHTVRIDHNSDCWGELDALKFLLKNNTRYSYEDLSNSEIVSIAIDELYDRLAEEKRAGKNQRRTD